MRTKYVKRVLITVLLMALAQLSFASANTWNTPSPQSMMPMDLGFGDEAASDEAFDETEEEPFEGASGDSFDDGEEAGDDASSDDQPGANVNRTAAEQSRIATIEQRHIAALHTPVENPELSIDAVLGYDGVITYAKQIPFTVTLKNTGADLDGSVCVNLYRDVQFYDRIEFPLFVASGSEKQVVLPVTLQMKQGQYTIEYCVDGAVVASASFRPTEALDPAYALIGALSSDPTSLQYMSLSPKNDPLMRGEYQQVLPLTLGTFPATERQLGAFGMLIVDGVDLRMLDSAQLQALDTWLKAGGVAIVGGGAGAAAGYPFFEDYTGIEAGALSAVDDITPNLMAYLGIAEEALTQGALINDMLGAATTLVSSSTAQPIIAWTQLDGGQIYTAAFELGAKPLTDWKGISTLWQRVMLKNRFALDQTMFINANVGWDYNDDDSKTIILDRMPIENEQNVLPIPLLLGGYLLLTGVICYFVLKKLDKRELLWGLMPVLGICCALSVWGVSMGAGFNTPVATSYTHLSLSENDTPTMTTYAGISSQDNAPTLVSAGAGVTLDAVNMDVYYDNSTAATRTPTTLRLRYLLGDTMQLGFPASPAWSQRYIRLEGGESFEGGLDARIWIEDDGLHASIANDTAYPLTHCAVMTSMGYASMPDMAPGETATAAITFLTAEEEKLIKDAMTNDNFALVLDGRMLPQGQYINQYGDFYQFAEALSFPDEQIANAQQREQAQSRRSNGIEGVHANMRRDAIQLQVYNWTSNSNEIAFRFIAFSDELGKVTPTMNGQRAVRTAHMAMIDKAMTYEPIGPTGVIYYPTGMLTFKEANIEGGIPRLSDVDRSQNPYYQSFQINTQPAFGVQLPMNLVVTELAISTNYYDQLPPLCKLYNHQTLKWDEQKTAYIVLKGDAAVPYIGADGMLFASYAPGDETTRNNQVMAPSITLKGRADA